MSETLDRLIAKVTRLDGVSPEDAITMCGVEIRVLEGKLEQANEHIDALLTKLARREE